MAGIFMPNKASYLEVLGNILVVRDSVRGKRLAEGELTAPKEIFWIIKLGNKREELARRRQFAEKMAQGPRLLSEILSAARRIAR